LFIGYFEQTNDIIHSHIAKEEAVLVVCTAGVSRSVTVGRYWQLIILVCAYMMKYHKMDLQNALKIVKKGILVVFKK
jgi:protein-tyrosine phosphatase